MDLDAEMTGVETSRFETIGAPTLMRQEAIAAAAVVQSQSRAWLASLEPVAQRFANGNYNYVVTIARGSSDHAANYFAYLAMARLGRFVTSLPMSLLTLESAPLPLEQTFAIAFSQSGRSPDLIIPTREIRAAKGLTAAFVNDIQSPLADAAECTVGLNAGAETSVAATKSFIAQLALGATLVDRLKPHKNDSLDRLGDTLHEACLIQWDSAIAPLILANRLCILGRGTGLAVAQEAALKLKETCGIQAEAFSGAEFKHGPMALVEQGYPIIVFAPRGPSQAGLIEVAKQMADRGGRVWIVRPDDSSAVHPKVQYLGMVAADSIDHDPISLIQTFYLFAESLSRARGLNPDKPNHLSKVTLTH